MINIDIKNAFNTLPWGSIKQQMRKKALLRYLRRILGNYLFERKIQYTGPDGAMYYWNIYAGVPQGSVLGPILWNLTYDWVLEAVIRPRSKIICYADDTLVLAQGDSPEMAAR